MDGGTEGRRAEGREGGGWVCGDGAYETERGERDGGSPGLVVLAIERGRREGGREGERERSGSLGLVVLAIERRDGDSDPEG